MFEPGEHKNVSPGLPRAETTSGLLLSWREKSMLKFKIFIGLCLMFGVCSAHANSLIAVHDDAAEFLQIEQKIEDAVVRADVEYLKNIYAEDFRFAHGSGSVQNKAQWLISVGKRQFISRTISANEAELHDEIAITSARLDVTRRGKNGEEKYWLKYVRVYRRSDTGWKMISHRTTQETHL